MVAGICVVISWVAIAIKQSEFYGPSLDFPIFTHIILRNHEVVTVVANDELGVTADF
ncbi:hypothetical protein D3C72_2461550 [compost metagenome]